MKTRNYLIFAVALLLAAFGAAHAQPVITSQPVGQIAAEGSSVTFSLIAAGDPAPTFQWRFNGVDLPGRNGRILNLAKVQLTNSGEYTALVSNPAGSVLSAPAILTVRVPDLISQWNATAFSAIGVGGVPVSRAFAMMHVAQFDAVNAVAGRFTPYCTSLVAPNASPEAAASQAAFVVLTNVLPSSRGAFQNALNRFLQDIPDGPAKTAGIALGQAVAERVILLRASDGINLTVPYTPKVAPGFWRPTAPSFSPVTSPHWRYVTLWALTSSTQFRLPPPPLLDSPIYTRDFIETRDYGRANSTFRTSAQTEIANFGSNSSELTHLLTRAALLVHPLPLDGSARVFALAAMANADDYVADWESRFTYSLWRPITAITLADTDSNPDTDKDASWAPLLDTPSAPEYPSGTTSYLGSTAEVLTSVFGDEYTFTLKSSFNSTPHTYHRLSDFMAEMANGRIYAGSHWRNSCEAGEQLGRAVGRHVVTNFLRPVPQLAGQPQAGSFHITSPPRRAADLVLEYSADLVNWLPLTDYTSPDSTWQFLDPAAANAPYRFYRLAPR